MSKLSIFEQFLTQFFSSIESPPCRAFNLWMPLDCAAAYGRPKCAKMLLEAGASVDPVDKVGFSVLFVVQQDFTP